MVLDDDQRRGIGTLLLAIMWLTAFRAGIGEIVGYTLIDNRRAANWMRDCGGEGSWDGYKLVFRWDLARPRLASGNPRRRRPRAVARGSRAEDTLKSFRSCNTPSTVGGPRMLKTGGFPDM